MQGCFINGSSTEYVFISCILTLFMLICLSSYILTICSAHIRFSYSLFFAAGSCSLLLTLSLLSLLLPSLFDLSLSLYFSPGSIPAALPCLPIPPFPSLLISFYMFIFALLAYHCSSFSYLYIFIFMLDPCCHGFCWAKPDTVKCTN